MTAGDNILDDLFHGIAFGAFIEQAIIEQSPPDPEATRQRAFRYYEQAIVEKRRRAAHATTASDATLPQPTPDNGTAIPHRVAG